MRSIIRKNKATQHKSGTMAPARSKLLLLSLLSCVSLAACNSGGSRDGSSNAPTPSPVPSSSTLSPLTIDSAGVVPAFSDAAVSTQIYVHNNTNSDITDLSYSYTVNLPKSSTTTKSIKLKSAVQNTNIPAGGIAALPINIPALGSKIGKGSALITASYTYQGKKHTFNQVINFHVISNSKSGVYLASGSVSSGFGNTGAAYTTIYAYGGGNAGTVYNVDQLKTDPVLGSVTQGNLAGSKIASHQVAAIELKTANIAKTAVGTIQLDSSNGKNKYTTSKSVAVIAQGGAANGNGQSIVLPSMVPFIDTASATSGTAYIYNAGTGDASIGNLTGTGGVSGVSLDPSCANNTLAPGQGCTVSFRVPKGAGNGTITATSTPVSGGDAQNITMAVTWYNSNSSLPQLGISGDSDAAMLLLHGTNPYTANLNVTVTDLGNAAISNVNAADPVVSGGSASATIATDPVSSCNNATLNSANPSCTYTVNVSDTKAPDSGNIILKANGTSGATNLSASDSVAYQVYRSAAQLAVSFTPASLTIIGDNFESAIGTVTISNVGSDDIASLSEENVNFTPTAGTLQYTTTTNCKDKPLAHGTSCTETVILIPQSYQSGAPEQGTLNYTVAADGIDETAGATPLNLTVQPYNSAIIVGAIDTTGGSSGDGKLATSAATFQAGSGNSSKVSLTYTNQSTTEAMTIGGVVFNDLPTYWQAEYGGDNNCLGASAQVPVHTQLAPGASCTVTLDNELYLLGNANTSTDLSFSLPTLVVNSSGTNQYAFIPGNNLGYSDGKYYATNYQAIITDTNQILNNGTATATLKVTHVATGIESGGYGGSISEKSIITPAMDLNLPTTTDAHCSAVKASGAVQETCTLTTGITTSNSYPVNWGATGVDPALGDTLTINYFDQLTGNAWAYNNDASMATGAGVNGGGDYVTIFNQATKFVFGTYTSNEYGSSVTPDGNVYTYMLAGDGTFSSPYNGTPNKTANVDISGTTPNSGISALRAQNGILYLGRGDGQVETCSYDDQGTVDPTSCTSQLVASSATTQIIALYINNNDLYVFPEDGKIKVCPIDVDTHKVNYTSCVNALPNEFTLSSETRNSYKVNVYKVNGNLVWDWTNSKDGVIACQISTTEHEPFQKCTRVPLPTVGMNHTSNSNMTNFFVNATSGAVSWGYYDHAYNQNEFLGKITMDDDSLQLTAISDTTDCYTYTSHTIMDCPTWQDKSHIRSGPYTVIDDVNPWNMHLVLINRAGQSTGYGSGSYTMMSETLSVLPNGLPAGLTAYQGTPGMLGLGDSGQYPYASQGVGFNTINPLYSAAGNPNNNTVNNLAFPH